MLQSPFELARRAARLEDPEHGLAAVAALRERLRTLEALHVENARTAGLSWAQIGALLGVSKQALHKRHARLLQPRRRERVVLDPGPQRVLVTADARRVVTYARQEARALGHRLVGTGHLALGLLRLPNEPAARALRAAGVSLDAARTTVDRVVAAAGLVDSDGRASVPISRAARRALEESLHEALRLGDSHLGPEHVLLAVLREQSGVSARMLEWIGPTAEEVEQRLLAELGRAGRNVRSAA
jgi:hypothetical protein